MTTHLEFAITPQPDEISCGPACLHAVYRFFGDPVPLERVMEEVQQLPTRGTLAVFLGLHALRRGYDATIYTCNLQLFDPSWFAEGAPPLRERLARQMGAKSDEKLRIATTAYLEFLERGGRIRMEDITGGTFAKMIRAGTPVIAGLSATWLYQCARELPDTQQADDIRGESTGHFVVVHGIDLESGSVHVADPWLHEPYPASHHYRVSAARVVGATLLGIVTYDAKLLIITPSREH